MGDEANQGSESVNVITDAQVQAPDEPKGNPAWSNMLAKLPKEFHSAIEPDLKEWDNNFSQKTSEVQSRYAPYQDFVDGEIDPNDIRQALSVQAMIAADPAGFRDALEQWGAANGIWDQGQQDDDDEYDDDELSFDDEDDEDDDIANHPKFQELSQQQDMLAQYLSQQIEQEDQAKASAELDSEIKTLTEKHGEFDEEFVIPYVMSTGVSLEDGVKKYHEHVKSIRSAPRAGDSAPNVLGSSGSIPSSQVDPGKMSATETKNLVKEMLARAKTQG